jgi:AcrR family transcriptional regulator
MKPRMAAARKPSAPTRLRLSSAQRHTQIMDSATELILQRGLLHCTLEEVATVAGISKALIYRHFSSRDELLAALLEREFSVLRGHGLGAFAPDTPFERIVRVATEKAFEYLYERGAILRELFSDRSVAQLLQARDRDERMTSTRFFVEKSIRTYRVPPEVAEIIAVITINAPAAAARGLRKFGFDPKHSSDVWSEFILGGWEAVARRFGETPPARPAQEATPAQAKPRRRPGSKR